MLNILFYFIVNICGYSWISIDIRKICEYLHNRYSYQYKNGYEMNIYPINRIRENYYMYLIHPDIFIRTTLNFDISNNVSNSISIYYLLSRNKNIYYYIRMKVHNLTKFWIRENIKSLVSIDFVSHLHIQESVETLCDSKCGCVKEEFFRLCWDLVLIVVTRVYDHTKALWICIILTFWD